MITPKLHLNGTPAKELIDAYQAASDAVDKAIVALSATAPNARDFITQEPNAFRQAREENARRRHRLVEVREELDAIILDLHDQEYERTR